MSAIPDTLEHLRVPIDSLKPHIGNPRRGHVQTIKASLARLGQYRPIVVNRGSLTGRPNEVLAGNHTVRAARDLGWKEIAATFVDVDEDTAARILLIDNRANDLAGYDDGALIELLQSLPDFDGTGYDQEALDDLLGDADLTPGKVTEPGPKPRKPKSRVGDLLLLGDHRLVCGDATSPDHMDLLLDSEPPALLFTDPPYGMDYQSAKLGGIEGDKLAGDELKALVHDSLALARTYIAESASTYVWCTWRTYPEFVEAVTAAGLEISGCIVWKKGRVGPGQAHYRPEHEFCLYCRPAEDNHHELCVYCAGDTWEGGRGQSDVWEISRDARYVHPTQKPIALAERAMENGTKRRQVVLDPFGGSGSTLIAAENLKRRARLMDLDPGYVDVIVDRWERHTGLQAERVRSDA